MEFEGTRSPFQGRKSLESKDEAARTAFHASLPAFSGYSTPADCDAPASLGYGVDEVSSGEGLGKRCAKPNGGANVNESGIEYVTAGEDAFISGGSGSKQYDDGSDSGSTLNLDLDEGGGCLGWSQGPRMNGIGFLEGETF